MAANKLVSAGRVYTEKMAYLLRQAVEAIKYTYGANEADITNLVRSGGRRPNYSSNGTPGPRGEQLLQIIGDGPDINVGDGEWVVRIANGILVLSADAFQAFFAES